MALNEAHSLVLFTTLTIHLCLILLSVMSAVVLIIQADIKQFKAGILFGFLLVELLALAIWNARHLHRAMLPTPSGSRLLLEIQATI